MTNQHSARQRFFNALFYGCLIVCLSGCGNTPELSPLAPDAKILAFGDSLTYGTGASKKGSYPYLLGKKIKRKVINAGVAGELSSAGVRRLTGQLKRHRPDLVILCHGGNDLIQKKDKTKIIKNLKKMISLIQKSGAEVVLVSVPKPGLLLKPAKFYQEIAGELNIPLENETLTEILTSPELKSDPAHPNKKGYVLLADRIKDLLSDSKAI